MSDIYKIYLYIGRNELILWIGNEDGRLDCLIYRSSSLSLNNQDRLRIIGMSAEAKM